MEFENRFELRISCSENVRSETEHVPESIVLAHGTTAHPLASPAVGLRLRSQHRWQRQPAICYLGVSVPLLPVLVPYLGCPAQSPLPPLMHARAAQPSCATGF